MTDWQRLGTYRVEDDTVRGILRIVNEGVATETIRYDPNTGTRKAE